MWQKTGPPLWFPEMYLLHKIITYLSRNWTANLMQQIKSNTDDIKMKNLNSLKTQVSVKEVGVEEIWRHRFRWKRLVLRKFENFFTPWQMFFCIIHVKHLISLKSTTKIKDISGINRLLQITIYTWSLLFYIKLLLLQHIHYNFNNLPLSTIFRTVN